MLNLDHTLLRRVSILGMLVGLLGATGDALMLYAPGFSRTPHTAVLLIPPGRSLIGLYLGVIFIPLYIIGYWVIYQILRESGSRHAGPIFFIGAYGVALGTTFHGMAGFLVKISLEGATSGPQVVEIVTPYLPLALPLFIVMHIILFLGSGWFGIAIWDRSTPFPRRVILLTPGLVSAVMFLIAGIIPVLGDFFIPTALNIGHIAFFAAAQTVLSRKDG